jgi:riboflavin transporter FmnP
MSRKPSKSYFIVSTAVLSALAIIFDVTSDAFPLRTPWGMKIDFVGALWVLAFFLYGLTEALSVSIITALFITAFMPTGFIGATMKFIATIPMFLVPALMSHISRSKAGAKMFNSVPVITVACISSTLVRLLAATIVNLYWAIPIYLGIPQEEVLNALGGLIPLIAFVAGMNVLQGVIDIFVSWLLAFKFKISEYFGTW